MLSDYGWIKYVGFIAGCITIFYSGRMYERNTQENKAKSVQIVEMQKALKNKDDVITTERLSRIASDNMLSSMRDMIESRNKYIESLNVRIKKDENRINSTNRINGLFLRYVAEATKQSNVPIISNPATGTYGESDIYSAADYLDYNVNQFKNCNDMVDKYKALQEWTKSEITRYNDLVNRMNNDK